MFSRAEKLQTNIQNGCVFTFYFCLTSHLLIFTALCTLLLTEICAIPQNIVCSCYVVCDLSTNFFNGLLTAHPDTIKVLFANLMHNFFIKSILYLYMF